MERGRGSGGGGAAAARRRRRQQSSSFADDWSFELGRMAIFGGDVSEEVVERAEARAADLALVDFAEGVENDEVAVMPEPEEDCEIGMVQVVNWYTQEVVSEAAVVPVTDEETGKAMLEFRGVRIGRKSSRWVLRVEYSETVLETMRAVGAMAYNGDVPGPAIEITLGAFDRWDSKFVNAEAPESKTWSEVQRMYKRVSEFICEMRMHNPHAVIVKA
jgi:hypothetical protein